MFQRIFYRKNGDIFHKRLPEVSAPEGLVVVSTTMNPNPVKKEIEGIEALAYRGKFIPPSRETKGVFYIDNKDPLSLLLQIKVDKNEYKIREFIEYNLGKIAYVEVAKEPPYPFFQKVWVVVDIDK